MNTFTVLYLIPAIFVLICVVLHEFDDKASSAYYEYTFGRLFVGLVVTLVPVLNIFMGIVFIGMAYEKLEVSDRIGRFMNKPVVPTIKGIFTRKKVNE